MTQLYSTIINTVYFPNAHAHIYIYIYSLMMYHITMYRLLMYGKKQLYIYIYIRLFNYYLNHQHISQTYPVRTSRQPLRRLRRLRRSWIEPWKMLIQPWTSWDFMGMNGKLWGQWLGYFTYLTLFNHISWDINNCKQYFMGYLRVCELEKSMIVHNDGKHPRMVKRICSTKRMILICWIDLFYFFQRDICYLDGIEKGNTYPLVMSNIET